MSVFSGIIPLITIANGGGIDSILNGLISQTVDVGLNYALSKTLGAEVAQFFGLPGGPYEDKWTGQKSWFGQLTGPGLISTGVTGLNQLISQSLLGSGTLGAFGPLATSLASAGTNFLGNSLTNLLFPSSKNSQTLPRILTPDQLLDYSKSKKGLFFPGAEGPGEAAASYWNSAYTLGFSGADVVFQIVPAAVSAKREADVAAKQKEQQQSQQNRAGQGTNTTQPSGQGQPEQPQAPAPGQIPANAPGSGVQDPKKTTDQNERAAEVVANTSADNTGTPDTLQQVGEASREGITEGTVIRTSADPITQAVLEGRSSPMGEKPDFTDSWKFICAPSQVSWDSSMDLSRLQIYGTNKAPVIPGAKGMRELTLSDAVVEGFNRGKNVEAKILLLEKLMNISISQKTQGSKKVGLIDYPVYRVYAQNKIYGLEEGKEGYFMIKSVKVKETLRDLTGRTTRATVDISFIQVPSYQVESGRDAGSAAISGRKSPASLIADTLRGGLNQAVNQGNQPQSGPQSSQAGPMNPRGSGPQTPGERGADGRVNPNDQPSTLQRSQQTDPPGTRGMQGNSSIRI